MKIFEGRDLFDNSLTIARRVLPFMGEKSIPATPENYTIFYHYFQGDNSLLKQLVEKHLNPQKSWTGETSRLIFQQIFGIQANVQFFKLNENMAKKVREMTKEIIRETSNTAELTDRARRNLKSSLKEVREVQEVRELAVWLQKTINEVKNVTDVSRGLGGKLRETGERLGEIVDSLNKMEMMVYTDELTQIANRRAWNSRLRLEFNRFVRYGRPCALIMLDLDDFKNINDTNGHQVGDQALKEVARILSGNLRVVDFPARYGGEEFSCLLPETSLKSGVEAAEKLRKSIAGTEFTIKGRITTITASFGVSCFLKDDVDADAALQRSDRAMYLAKSKGKNQVRSEKDLTAAEAAMAEKELK